MGSLQGVTLIGYTHCEGRGQSRVAPHGSAVSCTTDLRPHRDQRTLDHVG